MTNNKICLLVSFICAVLLSVLGSIGNVVDDEGLRKVLVAVGMPLVVVWLFSVVLWVLTFIDQKSKMSDPGNRKSNQRKEEEEK